MGEEAKVKGEVRSPELVEGRRWDRQGLATEMAPRLEWCSARQHSDGGARQWQEAQVWGTDKAGPQGLQCCWSGALLCSVDPHRDTVEDSSGTLRLTHPHVSQG